MLAFPAGYRHDLIAGVTARMPNTNATRPDFSGPAISSDGEVVAEVQRGYRLRDRVLRPALVAVAAGSGETSAADPDSTEQQH